MSEEQITKILQRMDQQDLALSVINKKLDELEPVRQAFNSVVGFDKIAVWIIKFLLGFADTYRVSERHVDSCVWDCEAY